MKIQKEKPKIGYVCSIAYHCELNETDVKIFPSLNSLKESQRCVGSECGIYEVEIKIKKVLKKENLFGHNNEKSKRIKK